MSKGAHPVRRPRNGRTIRSTKVANRRSRIHASLLKIGATLAAERGAENVSVEDIIEQAGISRATFYGFFASKSELLAAALIPVLEEATDLLDALDSKPASDILPGIVDLYLTLWHHHADALLLISALDEGVFPYIEKHHEKFTVRLRGLLAVCEDAGLLRNDSADYTFRVLARTAIPLLRVYRDHPGIEQHYRGSMLALLTR